jgi:hypothetical protein
MGMTVALDSRFRGNDKKAGMTDRDEKIYYSTGFPLSRE